MKLRIYTDTSVIGGYFDEEFQEGTTNLIDSFKMGKSIIVLSSVTFLELEKAPEKVKNLLNEIPEENKEYVAFTKEAEDLANRYISEGVIGSGSEVDAHHIAAATLARVDVLVSWNFKHIVNLPRIHGYNGVSLMCGFSLLEIRTPKEVLGYEKNEKDI